MKKFKKIKVEDVVREKVIKEKKVFTPDFLQIPQIVMHLPPSERFVFGAVYFYAQLSEKRCIASNATLGKVANIKPMTVANCLTKLEDAGFIKRYYKDEEKKNRDYIICLVSFSKVPLCDDTPIIKQCIVDTSPDEQNIIIKEDISSSTSKEVEEVFNSKEEFERWVDSPYGWLNVLGAYCKRKKYQSKYDTRALCDLLVDKHKGICMDIAKFSHRQISEAFNKCEELVETGKIKDWTIYTVKHKLLS